MEVELRPLNSAKRWPLCLCIHAPEYKTICWLASNFWILLGVMLEAGIDSAKIVPWPVSQHSLA